MRLVPLRYNVRSLWVRRSATLLTVLGLGATVAIVAGVLALQQGFQSLFHESGREDLLVYLRPSARRETESILRREQADSLIKERPEIAQDENGQPLASPEVYLAVRRHKVGGGETNVPIRGVGRQAFALHGQDLRISEGRRFTPGSDEVIVGARLVDRIQDCHLGDVLVVNVTPFRVVGILEHDGPFASEIWGDVDRIAAALDRQSYNRVIARARPGTDVEAVKAELENHPRLASAVFTEREFLSNQTGFLSAALIGLMGFLGLVMGVAAVFTATNTMLASLAARTHEIGILKSVGFRPLPIFAAFLAESVLLGLMGGILGSLMVLPLNGVETGTTNWDTFTEIAFAFRITPAVLKTAVGYALLLGLVGGAWPAWRAARMTPTEALRRG